MENDKYNLQRFVKAQQDTYSKAYIELSQGNKQSHWMWWTFPQIEGLGMTGTSHKYAIKSLSEAKAYLEHPYIARNLHELCNILLSLNSDNATSVFGHPDDLKLRSSMTLFSEADPDDTIFLKVLNKFYAGIKDERTLELLK